MTTAPTSGFTAFALAPFPELQLGDNLADGDIVVVAGKAVSVSEKRYAALTDVTPGPEAVDLSARTGKPAEIVQLILDHSTSHFLATPRGPIIAKHLLGHQLTSAGIDRAGTDGAWLLPADPDASARTLRDTLTSRTGAQVAVVIADSDGRAERRGATVLSIGAAGIILGQRGRGAPVVVLRGIAHTPSDDGPRRTSLAHTAQAKVTTANGELATLPHQTARSHADRRRGARMESGLA